MEEESRLVGTTAADPFDAINREPESDDNNCGGNFV